MVGGGSHSSSFAGGREQVVGVVLCGGESRRMGADKGRVVLGGETMVHRASRLIFLASSNRLASGEKPRRRSSAVLMSSRGCKSCSEKMPVMHLSQIIVCLPTNFCGGQTMLVIPGFKVPCMISLFLRCLPSA